MVANARTTLAANCVTYLLKTSVNHGKLNLVLNSVCCLLPFSFIDFSCGKVSFSSLADPHSTAYSGFTYLCIGSCVFCVFRGDQNKDNKRNGFPKNRRNSAINR